jgi:hypothetical protein
MIGTNSYYVYKHINPVDGSVFYIGKGKGKRAFSKTGRNAQWREVVNKCGFIVQLEKEGLYNDEANNLELKLISEYGLSKLTNITKGGIGGDTISNHPNRQQIVEKIGYHSRGDKNPNWQGKYHNEEYFRKQSISNSKKPLLVIDTLTNTKYEFINSKQVATFLDAKHSTVRMAKNKYKLQKRYLILDNNAING